MPKRKSPPSEETLHQWKTIESARLAKGVSKSKLSTSAGFHTTYYYQTEKAKRPIEMAALAQWAKDLEIPLSNLFLQGETDSRLKMISLIQNAPENKLPQALRVLEAVLDS